MGAAHFAAALAALALGAGVIGAAKATPFHRTIGAGYVAAMIIVNLTALAIYRLTGHFEPFHALAVLNLALLGRGLAAVLRRRPGWLPTHYRSMAWSYIGLSAAACSEIVVRLFARSGVIGQSWQIIAGGLVVALVFAAMGFILLPRLQRGAVAYAFFDPKASSRDRPTMMASLRGSPDLQEAPDGSRNP
jgi:uncharacterized membrane protein